MFQPDTDQTEQTKDYTNNDSSHQHHVGVLTHAKKFSSSSCRLLNTKKSPFSRKVHQAHLKYSSYSSSSQATSFLKKSLTEHQLLPLKVKTEINYYIEKYLPRGAHNDDICPEMRKIIERKNSEIEALKLYRDELKFMSCNSPYTNSNNKLNLRLLREKIFTENKIQTQREELSNDMKKIDEDYELLEEYIHMIQDSIQTYRQSNQNFMDMEEEENIMIRNLEGETQMLVKELEEEKRKNNREVRVIQEQILDLRIQIKQKQDRLRDLKAKICTMYIKLHSRNSRGGYANCKSRNLSLSVRKFNKQNFSKVEEIFIGNATFKNYGREIIEKVTQNDDLKKLKIFLIKNQLTFQCIYEGRRQGIIHNYHDNISESETHTTSEQSKTFEFETKYLLSIKFFYRSKIVGIECRIKTEKGNKHAQIGNCSSNLQHELVTLINKKLVTIASYWYGKQMIGVSLWTVSKPLVKDKDQKSQKNLAVKAAYQVQQQYYS